jgi:hypothetical protein
VFLSLPYPRRGFLTVSSSSPGSSSAARFTMPLVSRFFTVLDASSFFHQLPVWGPHRDRMIIVSPRGLEVANVALMGFRNSPAFAQRFMDNHLRKFKQFCRAYIDDVIIFSRTAEEHAEYVKVVLDVF